MRRSDLPFGSEFSPSQVNLPRLLELAHTYGGDWHRFEEAIRTEYFEEHATNEYNRRKLANNTRLGMIAYGIVQRDAILTDFGRDLYARRDKETALYETLARHILLNLNGLALVTCIRDMNAAGEVVDLTSLREALAARGVHFPRGGKHPNIMRLWLAKAGVFVGSRWEINEARLSTILGTEPDTYSALAKLTPEQRAFLNALCNTGIRTPQPANAIARLATTTWGVKFPEKSMPKLVLNALVEAGYITVQKTTGGRGAKPFLVAPTDKLICDIVEPILQQVSRHNDPRLLDLLRKPLSEIMAQLESDDRHVSGLALEALGFKLMRMLDMDYVATRLRSSATGGAEVDLVFESARLVFSRWQVQCKNTERVALDDVAKEVGLTHFLHSTVIVVVTTGRIGSEARKYAASIMSHSNLAIVLIDGQDLKAISGAPTDITKVFEREAQQAMKLKSLDISARQ